MAPTDPSVTTTTLLRTRQPPSKIWTWAKLKSSVLLACCVYAMQHHFDTLELAMAGRSSRPFSASMTLVVAGTLAVLRAWVYTASATSFVSATSFTAAALVFAAATALAIHKPWLTRARVSESDIARILVNGGLLAISTFLLVYCIKVVDPLRAILLDYSDICVMAGFAALFGANARGRRSPSGSRTTLYLTLAGLLLVLWYDPRYHASQLSAQRQQVLVARQQAYAPDAGIFLADTGPPPLGGRKLLTTLRLDGGEGEGARGPVSVGSPLGSEDPAVSYVSGRVPLLAPPPRGAAGHATDRLAAARAAAAQKVNRAVGRRKIEEEGISPADEPAAAAPARPGKMGAGAPPVKFVETLDEDEAPRAGEVAPAAAAGRAVHDEEGPEFRHHLGDEEELDRVAAPPHAGESDETEDNRARGAVAAAAGAQPPDTAADGARALAGDNAGAVPVIDNGVPAAAANTATAAASSASKSKRAAALVAARRSLALRAESMRLILEAHTQSSVLLAGVLMCLGAWAGALRRRLSRDIAATSGLGTRKSHAAVIAAAAALWLPVALFKSWVLSGPTLMSSSGDAHVSGGGGAPTPPSFAQFIAVACLFGTTVLLFAEYVSEMPLTLFSQHGGSSSGGIIGDGVITAPPLVASSNSGGAEGALAGLASAVVGGSSVGSALPTTKDSSGGGGGNSGSGNLVSSDAATLRSFMLAVGFYACFAATALYGGDSSFQITAALCVAAIVYVPGTVVLSGADLAPLLRLLTGSDDTWLWASGLVHDFWATAAPLLGLESSGGSAYGGGGYGGSSPRWSSSGGGGDKVGFSSSSSQLAQFAALTRKVMAHVYADTNSRKIFTFLCINFAFMFVEIVVGYLTNSLGLISDAGHMFFDNASLFIGLYASYMARWKPDGEYTYGYARYEIMAGFVNAVFLVFVAVSVVFEALERLWEPPEIHGEHVLPVSVLGLGVNIIGLVFFHDSAHGHSHGGGGGHGHAPHPPPTPTGGGGGHDSHGHSHGGGGACSGNHSSAPASAHDDSSSHAASHTNENMYGVWLHVLADALGSVGVICSSLLIKWYGWYLADPIASLAISLLILASVVPLVQVTAGPLLSRVPEGLESALRRAVDVVSRLPGVSRVEHPHFWKHHGDCVVGTLHVLLQPGCTSEDETRVLRLARSTLTGAGVQMLTVQVEVEAGDALLVSTASVASPVQQQLGHSHDHRGHSHGHASSSPLTSALAPHPSAPAASVVVSSSSMSDAAGSSFFQQQQQQTSHFGHNHSHGRGDDHHGHSHG